MRIRLLLLRLQVSVVTDLLWDALDAPLPRIPSADTRLFYKTSNAAGTTRCHGISLFSIMELANGDGPAISVLSRLRFRWQSQIGYRRGVHRGSMFDVNISYDLSVVTPSSIDNLKLLSGLGSRLISQLTWLNLDVVMAIRLI